jgi:glucose/arabinose dehydrogenase
MVLLLAAATARAENESLPSGFELSTVATDLTEPIALEFAPDGRLFVAERNGTVRYIENGLVSDVLFPKIEVFYENENGLLGMALDPGFATNGLVYIFATVSINETQILRFVDPRVSSTASTDPPAIVRDHLPTQGVFHSGGGLKAGPDGKLYFGIGDNLEQDNAQDLNTLAGKISRINLDGTTPDDNPLRTTTGAPRTIWALGLRNPFRFCFAPDGRLFVMDVGSDGEGRREEINLVTPGGNYGWPEVEGSQTGLFRDPQYIDPLYDYHDGGAAPVGGVYYTGDLFPGEYAGSLFYLEYVLNRLYRLTLDGDSASGHETFAQLDGGPIDLAQGPDGALYYCELNTGRIMRIGHPRAPEVAGAIDEAPPLPADPTADLAPSAPLCGGGSLFGVVAVALAVATARRPMLINVAFYYLLSM